MLNSHYKIALTGILMFFIFSVGCTKIDTTTLGEGLIPAVDNIHTFDTTLAVIANNYDDLTQCDSVGRKDLHALGIVADDPYFGKTNANIYVGFKPEAYPFNLPAHSGDSLYVDSAVIVLQYAYSFGDTNQVQKVNVFTLGERFKNDSVYKTCDVLNYQSILIGEKTYTPTSLRDSVHAFRENAANQLRIPIDKSLIESWFEMGPAMFASDSAFNSRFRGFALVADESTGGQALNYFSLTSQNTRLSLYVRSSKDGKKDTAVFDFPVTGQSGRANSIIRTRGNAEITQHLDQPVEGDSVLYLQTSPGNNVMLSIPGISALSNRVINRAELIVEQLYSPAAMDGVFYTPSALYLDTKDTSATYFMPMPCDFNMTDLQNNLSILGGNEQRVKDAGGNDISRYVFNISRFVQSVVTRSENNPVLRLRAPFYVTNNRTYLDRCNQVIQPFSYLANPVAYGRIKLNGTNQTASRIRLRVIYSTL